ncbi:hypothetical protein KIN20_016464 [Parelaphostrongylus tenuis]|uniref:Uncharacterized protein n=1 Tax=Parelaphostrongylus tenuis TaxID=148309 RepID=A0AAD5MLL8_PARTN|nr:hypothetical protein KIN20_016464 [Parelaphostrongylus tenuis]
MIQHPEEVIVRWRQFKTVRRIIQDFSAQLGELPRCQYGNIQLCVVLNQNDLEATST